MISIKVCGVTTPDDARACVDAGADRLGVNLVPASPRRVDVETAREIVRSVGDRVEVLVVVADLGAEDAAALLAAIGASRLQLHGDEPDDVVRALGPRAVKAVRLGDAADVARAVAAPGELVLVDAKVAGALGGTGTQAPLDLAAEVARARPTLLAGGLSPENVALAVARVRPAGVDVASGVERPGDPRRKSPDAVARFVEAVRDACRRAPRG
ncbi:MAG: phosphoribosylanthranilate isomerase [Polyangiaceae bacterium]|nr:phosphoribosylanthranilate isomerase [Polyangiaceae bacterium]